MVDNGNAELGTNTAVDGSPEESGSCNHQPPTSLHSRQQEAMMLLNRQTREEYLNGGLMSSAIKQHEPSFLEENSLDDEFLGFFDSSEVPPLECPSVGMFDDEENDMPLPSDTHKPICKVNGNEDAISLFGNGGQNQFSSYHSDRNNRIPRYVEFSGSAPSFNYEDSGVVQHNGITGPYQNDFSECKNKKVFESRDRPEFYGNENDESANLGAFDGTPQNFHFMETPPSLDFNSFIASHGLFPDAMRPT